MISEDAISECAVSVLQNICTIIVRSVIYFLKLFEMSLFLLSKVDDLVVIKHFKFKIN